MGRVGAAGGAARRERHPSFKPAAARGRYGASMKTPRTPCLVLSAALALLAPPAAPQEADAPSSPLVAIYVYEGVELLDFAGPGEVFACVPGARVVTVAESREPVTSMGFVEVVPNETLETCPEPDIVVVPGGGVRPPSAALRAWLERTATDGTAVVSVCNGAVTLAECGLLAGLPVTTHHGSFERLALAEPTARVLTNRRFVDNGNVLTTAGISAGIDGSLHLVQRLYGAGTARHIAEYMEYDWRPEAIAADHARPGEAVELGAAADVLASLAAGDAASALAAHREAIAALDHAAAARVERLVNLRGYGFLQNGRVDEALEVFRFQVEAFPLSANPCDSLSEALLTAGDEEGARRWAEETLARLDMDTRVAPERAAAVRRAATDRLARLSGAAVAGAWICPPCGGTCDQGAYASAGDCPGCGMTLVAREG